MKSMREMMLELVVAGTPWVATCLNSKGTNIPLVKSVLTASRAAATADEALAKAKGVVSGGAIAVDVRELLKVGAR